MKNKFLTLLTMAGVLLLAVGCKKELNQVQLESNSTVALTANATTLSLAYANAQKEVVKFTWNNPEYKFNTGVSSLDVSYLLEIDTTGANFTNPNKKVFSISKDLSLSLTDSALNDALLNQLNLKSGIPHNLEMRVVASLVNSTAPVVSNVLKYTGVVPYAIPPKVAIPTTGNLYLIGSATPGGDATGWNNPVPLTQQFTKIDDTHYELVINLIGGKEYLMLPLNGSWDNKYAVENKSLAGLSEGGDFGFNKNDNFPGPASSGLYKISVDFQRGKFTVTKQ